MRSTASSSSSPKPWLQTTNARRLAVILSLGRGGRGRCCLQFVKKKTPSKAKRNITKYARLVCLLETSFTGKCVYNVQNWRAVRNYPLLQASKSDSLALEALFPTFKYFPRKWWHPQETVQVLGGHRQYRGSASGGGASRSPARECFGRCRAGPDLPDPRSRLL